MSAQNQKKQKCYNSFSCILSVFIIVFVLTSIIWDMFVTKPAIRESIDEIKSEVQIIHNKIDKTYTTFAFEQDSLAVSINKMADEIKSEK